MTEHQKNHIIASALRTAAMAYRDCARTFTTDSPNERLADQFNRQADEAEAVLAEMEEG